MAPRDRPVAAPPFAMRKRGARKRLKFRGDDVCSQRVTVADYANSDPAVVKSGRMKKAVANAVQQEENADGAVGQEYPIDIWLVLASYIRPEDIVNFSLICKRAWTAICTAAFWTRLYRRHYNRTAPLPIRLQPESMEKMYCLRACVIRSLYHMYRPFASRVARNPAIPETTPSTLKNSKCLLFWSKRVDKPSSLWEFSFKFKRLSPKFKNSHLKLQPPVRYEDVHLNPDQDCCVLQITTLDFIYIPIVMGMSVTLFTINVSTDMRHHRVKMVFHDSPVWNGKKPRFDHGVQVIMDPVHSVRLFDWWHPQFPSSHI
ncbi:transmembrane protein 183A isoform X3 [Sphaerodactylus townsendi]|uniref:transmembrane protein 183A isoform X3 n=1 Tax=Sphaerodactylus townsendi TaxID=933632 RepID=UPI0020271949|nr:transmembrane protein 183A isoform X3 [Sphaerodactylus townsendi]